MVEKAVEQEEKDERIKKREEKRENSVWHEQFLLTLTSFNRHKETVGN